jgi:FMN-binding protein
MDRSIVTRLGLAVATVALAAVLLVNLQSPDSTGGAGGSTTAARGSGTGSSGTTTGRTGSGTGTTGTGTTGTGSSGTGTTGTGGSGTGTGGGSATGTQTLTGSVVMTRYGPVQVDVTLTNGKITAITATELPSGGRSGMISSIVEPMLRSEALTAQSASIDIVSGATYTSRAYASSLQAALDSAT